MCIHEAVHALALHQDRDTWLVGSASASATAKIRGSVRSSEVQKASARLTAYESYDQIARRALGRVDNVYMSYVYMSYV